MGHIHFEPYIGLIYVRLRLAHARTGGFAWLKFGFDTGATRSVIDERLAKSLGYRLRLLCTPAITVGGPKRMSSVQIPRMWLAFNGMHLIEDHEIRAMRLPAALRVDGLLGLDLITRFTSFLSGDLFSLANVPFRACSNSSSRKCFVTTMLVGSRCQRCS